jgi:predicted RNA-binding Zn-ribbon protein involved in translation (DUF1610 family)
MGDNVYDESMSKITFRADEELIRRIEEFDASKSEVMREALRAYLDDHGSPAADSEPASDSLDELVAERVDELVAERVDALVAERLDRSFTQRRPQDVNVNVTLDGGFADEADAAPADVNARREPSHTSSNDVSNDSEESKTSSGADENTDDDDRKTCTQCGTTLSPSHVYCPNCGEKSARRVFCECGDEIRSDWGFCPSCGRRTPAADVLDRS